MTMIPLRFKKNLVNKKIILSVSNTLKEKETTFDFKKTELSSLNELMNTMNNSAISSGLFFNGHRNRKSMRAMGNVYFIDIDSEPKDKETPYYLEVEQKLKNLNISFVSVPSKSADKYPYKRHIAIILNNDLPINQEDYQRVANEIIYKIGIDLNKIDSRVKENQFSFLAPCIINKNFKDYNEKSYFHNGNPLQIEENRNVQLEKLDIEDKGSIQFDTFLTFSDGKRVQVFDAKKLIDAGVSAGCFCPKHDDKNPSATYYHNKDGSVNIVCSVCGTIKISKSTRDDKPIISHSQFNYSIIIAAKNKKIENDLKIILGFNYQKVDNLLIWSYKIDTIDDIYLLMLTKIQLVNDGYSLLNLNKNNRYLFAEKQLLREYSKNTKPLNVFIDKNVKSIPHTIYYIKVSKAIFNNYIFPEVAIYEAFLTYPEINSLERICDKGLAYFEYILNTREKEKNEELQENKTFPSRLNKEEKEISNKNREISKMKTKTKSMNKIEEKIYRLIESKKFNKRNGELNKSALSKEMKMARSTLYSYIDSINSKKNKD